MQGALGEKIGEGSVADIPGGADGGGDQTGPAGAADPAPRSDVALG